MGTDKSFKVRASRNRKGERNGTFTDQLKKEGGKLTYFPSVSADQIRFALTHKGQWLQRLSNVREIVLLSFCLDPSFGSCLSPTYSSLLLLSLYLSVSPFLCSCLLPRETKSGGERKLMKTGICGNGDRDREGGGMERWGPSGDGCNMSRMIMTSELFLLLSSSTVVVSQGKIHRTCMWCNI